MPTWRRCSRRRVSSEVISAMCTMAKLRRWIRFRSSLGGGDGAVDGLRSPIDVARGSVGGVCGDVFEEIEERFAHLSGRVHHGMNSLCTAAAATLYLLFFSVSRFTNGVATGYWVAPAGLRSVCVTSCLVHDVGD